MAQPLLRTRPLIGVTSPGCPRCWDFLSPSSLPQKRRTQIRGLSSCRTNAYEATLSPPPSRHIAASRWQYSRSSGGSSTGGTRALPTSARSSYALPVRILRTTPRLLSSCLFSTSARLGSDASQTARPEPPDHLDEKERAIFDRLNEALAPIELQVRSLTLH